MCLVDNSRLTEGVVTVEAVSRKDYRQVTMTAMVTRYVKAVFTLECAHRRQLLTTVLLGRLPFPLHSYGRRCVHRRPRHSQHPAFLGRAFENIAT